MSVDRKSRLQTAILKISLIRVFLLGKTVILRQPILTLKMQILVSRVKMDLYYSYLIQNFQKLGKLDLCPILRNRNTDHQRF